MPCNDKCEQGRQCDCSGIQQSPRKDELDRGVIGIVLMSIFFLVMILV